MTLLKSLWSYNSAKENLENPSEQEIKQHPFNKWIKVKDHKGSEKILTSEWKWKQSILKLTEYNDSST
jgi:hypothetical protein